MEGRLTFVLNIFGKLFVDEFLYSPYILSFLLNKSRHFKVLYIMCFVEEKTRHMS